MLRRLCSTSRLIPAHTWIPSRFASAATGRVASVQCRCGDVQVTFSSDKPVHSWECCCVDCFDKNLWSCHAGGVPPPPGREKHGIGRPLVLCYYPSRMVVQGKEKIRFNVLREGSTSTNMVTSCCSTLLCVDHPFYQGNVVLTCPEFLPVTGVDEPLPPTPMRVHIKDWPKDEYAKLPPLPGMYREGGTVKMTCPEAEDIRSTAARLFGVPPPDTPGETFHELLATHLSAGGVVTNLGLKEGANSYQRSATPSSTP